jgi:hypothetical protein
MSLKETAIRKAMGPALALVESWTKDITAKNEVAGFVEKAFPHLLRMPPGEGEEVGGILPLLVKVMVAEANERPDFVEEKILRFYEEFRVYYREKHPPTLQGSEVKRLLESDPGVAPR